MQNVTRKLRDFFASSSPPGVVAVYLFGSSTRRAHRESDVDIGILLDRGLYAKRSLRGRMRIVLIADLIHALSKNEVDVVILNDAPPELAKHVATQGVPVLINNREENHAFVRDAQLRAADIAPFLARMRRLKLEYATR